MNPYECTLVLSLQAAWTERELRVALAKTADRCRDEGLPVSLEWIAGTPVASSSGARRYESFSVRVSGLEVPPQRVGLVPSTVLTACLEVLPHSLYGRTQTREATGAQERRPD